MSGPLDPVYSSIVDVNGDVAQVSSNGGLLVAPAQRATYSNASVALALATGATDAVTLSGSATKTIRILTIEITGTKTIAGQENIVLLKRNTANTGGTIAFSQVGGAHDSQNPPSSGVFTQYTANPSGLGNLVMWIKSVRIFWPALATVSAPSVLQWSFIYDTEQSIVLRGANELLCVNMNAGSVAGDTLYVSMTWTEE